MWWLRGSRTARRSAVALLAAAALALTGCGGDAGSGGGDDRTLTVWIMEGTNPDAEPFFSELSAAFTERTGATLDVQFVQWASAHDRFITAIAGGTTPDVAEVGTTWVAEFADAGALVDLEPRVQEAGLADGLVDGLVEAGTIGDGLYGMPWYAGVRSIVYRTDVFAELGLQPPTTWDELVAVGQRIKQARPDLLPLPIAGDNEFIVYPFLWGAGGEVATRNGDTWVSGVDSPQAREGIQFYADLALVHGFSTPAAATWRETDVRDAFTKGQAAMIFSGSWTPKAILEARPGGQDRRVPDPRPRRRAGALGARRLAAVDLRDERRPGPRVAARRDDEHRRVRREVGPGVELLPRHHRAAGGGRAVVRPAGRAVRAADGRVRAQRAGHARVRPDPGQEDDRGDDALHPHR